MKTLACLLLVVGLAAARRTPGRAAACTQPAPSKPLLCYYEGRVPIENSVYPCLCSHIVHTSAATIADDFTLQLDPDVTRLSRALAARNPSLKLLVSVGGQRSAAQRSERLTKSPEKRATFAASAAKALRDSGLHGVEVDLRLLPTAAPRKREGLVELLKALRGELGGEPEVRTKRDYDVIEHSQDDVDDAPSWKPKKRNATLRLARRSDAAREKQNSLADELDAADSSLLLLRVPIQPEIIVKRYDLKNISKYVDWFTVPTHNLTDPSEEGFTFHPSRLMGLADLLNTDSMLDLLTGLGAPHNRIIISVPASGTKFTLEDPKKNTPRSPVTSGPEWISQGKLCSLMSEGGWTMERDEDLTAPYAFRNNTWLAFDDRISAGIKGKYALLRDLAGAAIFPLDDDDLGGACAPFNNKSSSPWLVGSLHDAFTRLARKSREVVLESLQDEIKQSTLLTFSGDLQLSPYRITRIVDTLGAVHVVRREARTQFECSRQGYFVHPLGCNRFYRCVKFNQRSADFTVFEYDCPAGLAFDERWEVCVWPGSLPRGSPCTGSSEIAPVPRARYACPAIEGYYADPENCRWFFACLDHARDGATPLTAYEFRCPFGLVFDERTLTCDWPWLVEGCGSGFRAAGYFGAVQLGAVGLGYAGYDANGAAFRDASINTAAASIDSSAAVNAAAANAAAANAAAARAEEFRRRNNAAAAANAAALNAAAFDAAAINAAGVPVAGYQYGINAGAAGALNAAAVNAAEYQRRNNAAAAANAAALNAAAVNSAAAQAAEYQRRNNAAAAANAAALNAATANAAAAEAAEYQRRNNAAAAANAAALNAATANAAAAEAAEYQRRNNAAAAANAAALNAAAVNAAAAEGAEYQRRNNAAASAAAANAAAAQAAEYQRRNNAAAAVNAAALNAAAVNAAAAEAAEYQRRNNAAAAANAAALNAATANAAAVEAAEYQRRNNAAAAANAAALNAATANAAAAEAAEYQRQSNAAAINAANAEALEYQRRNNAAAAANAAAANAAAINAEYQRRNNAAAAANIAALNAAANANQQQVNNQAYIGGTYGAAGDGVQGFVSLQSPGSVRFSGGKTASAGTLSGRGRQRVGAGDGAFSQGSFGSVGNGVSYIATGQKSEGSDSYYRDRDIPSFASLPDSFVSGGRIDNTGGVVLGTHLVGLGGLEGATIGATGGYAGAARIGARPAPGSFGYRTGSVGSGATVVSGAGAVPATVYQPAVNVLTQQGEPTPVVQSVTPVSVVQSVTPVPAVQPFARIPVAQPVAQVPVVQTVTPSSVVQPVSPVSFLPTVRRPVLQPVAQFPVVQSVTPVPFVQSVTPVPVVQPVNRVSFSRPVARVPAVQPVAQLPVVQPVAQVPVVQSVTPSPFVQSVTPVPVVQPVNRVSFSRPVVRVPAVQPVAQLPVVQPVAQVPIVQSVTPSPFVQSVTPVPAIQPVSRVSFSQPFARVPAVQPLAQVPVVQSVTPTPFIQSVTPVPAIQPVSRVSFSQPFARVPAVQPLAQVPVVQSVTPSPFVQSVTPVPAIQPVSRVSFSQPFARVPAVQPLAQVPVVQSVTPTPFIQSVTPVPAVQPVSRVSFSQPFARVPAIQPLDQVPVVQSVTPTPFVQSVTSVPAVQPLGRVSFAQPIAKVPVVQPVAQLPVIQSVTPTPFIQSVTPVPAVQPVSRVSFSQPIPRVPVVQPVGQVPVIQSVTPVPFVQSVTPVPAVQPVNRVSFSRPVAKVPFVQPVQQVPIVQSVTPSAIVQSVTPVPVFQPVSKVSVAEPLAQVPLIQTYTSAPVVQAPSTIFDVPRANIQTYARRPQVSFRRPGYSVVQSTPRPTLLQLSTPRPQVGTVLLDGLNYQSTPRTVIPQGQVVQTVVQQPDIQLVGQYPGTAFISEKSQSTLRRRPIISEPQYVAAVTEGPRATILRQQTFEAARLPAVQPISVGVPVTTPRPIYGAPAVSQIEFRQGTGSGNVQLGQQNIFGSDIVQPVSEAVPVVTYQSTPRPAYRIPSVFRTQFVQGVVSNQSVPVVQQQTPIFSSFKEKQVNIVQPLAVETPVVTYESTPRPLYVSTATPTQFVQPFVGTGLPAYQKGFEGTTATSFIQSTPRPSYRRPEIQLSPVVTQNVFEPTRQSALRTSFRKQVAQAFPSVAPILTQPEIPIDVVTPVPVTTYRRPSFRLRPTPQSIPVSTVEPSVSNGYVYNNPNVVFGGVSTTSAPALGVTFNNLEVSSTPRPLPPAVIDSELRYNRPINTFRSGSKYTFGTTFPGSTVSFSTSTPIAPLQGVRVPIYNVDENFGLRTAFKGGYIAQPISNFSQSSFQFGSDFGSNTLLETPGSAGLGIAQQDIYQYQQPVVSSPQTVVYTGGRVGARRRPQSKGRINTFSTTAIPSTISTFSTPSPAVAYSTLSTTEGGVFRTSSTPLPTVFSTTVRPVTYTQDIYASSPKVGFVPTSQLTVSGAYLPPRRPGRVRVSTTTASPITVQSTTPVSGGFVDLGYSVRPGQSRKGSGSRTRINGDENVGVLLDQYSGKFGNNNENFVNDVINGDLYRKQGGRGGSRGRITSTSGTFESTTVPYRPTTSDVYSSTTSGLGLSSSSELYGDNIQTDAGKTELGTATIYNEDGGVKYEAVKIGYGKTKGSREPVVVVTRLSDVNPILVAKLGAQCTCRSNAVSLKKPSSSRGRTSAAATYSPIEYDATPTSFPGLSYSSVTSAPYLSSTIPSSVPGADGSDARARFGSAPVVVTPRPGIRTGLPTVASTTGRPSVDVEYSAILPSGIDPDELNGSPSFQDSVTSGRGANGNSVGGGRGLDGAGGAGVGAGRSFDRYGPGGLRGADETLQGSVDCQRPGLFRHPKYCNKFYACHWDEWKGRYTLHVFNCPVQLAYDSNLGACNWPSQGPACADDNLLV